MPNQYQFSVYIQYIVPHHLLSTFMGWLADLRLRWLKNWMINRFIKKYHVDMSIAKIEDPVAYPTFNHFFIRQLKPSLRPVANDQRDIASPVDGTIAQIGQIYKSQLLQAKSHYYDLTTLLCNDAELVPLFGDGSFATLYLAPHNYHRVHMPLSGTLKKTIYVPGKLFSVNSMTSALIPNLYSRNERLISIFHTDAGPMAVILVGAMIVGSIQTVWMNNPIRSKKIQRTNHLNDIYLQKGAELGHFRLGSTVIILFGKHKIKWVPSLNTNSPVQFGQLLGNFA